MKDSKQILQNAPLGRSTGRQAQRWLATEEKTWSNACLDEDDDDGIKVRIRTSVLYENNFKIN